MKIGLIGLPKSGKTTLFNLLTGSKVANVVFFGLNRAASRSTRGSGTRATPVCSSARPES